MSLETPSPAHDAPEIRVTKNGDTPSMPSPDDFFSGTVRIDKLFQPQADTTRASGAYVTFEPGARTAWHTHPRGQTLVVTAGRGWVQRWGDAAQTLQPGDVVWIPAGQKHWHGASDTTAMTHIAIQEEHDGTAVAWLEKVSDAQYSAR